MNAKARHPHHRDHSAETDVHDSVVVLTDGMRVTEKLFTDPGCGMKVASDAGKSVEYNGTAYRFCSTKCMEKFRAHPLSYTAPATAGSAAAAAILDETVYPCPSIRKFGRQHLGTVRNAGWRLSRSFLLWKEARIRS